MDVLAFVKSRGNFPSLMMGFGTILAGTAAAAIRGNMDVLAATVCLLFAFATQLGANYFHSWCIMMRGGHNEPRPRIDDGEFHRDSLSLRVVREASTACLILSLMLGLTLMTMSSNHVMSILTGLIIYGIAISLNYGKHPLYGSVWAVVSTFLLFGPIGVIGTTMIQSQNEEIFGLSSIYDTAPATFLGVGMGFLACSVHLLYSYHNYRIDPGMNPRSITLLLGPRTTQFMVFLNGLMMFMLVSYHIFSLNFPDPFIAIVPLFLGFALNTYISLRMSRANFGELKHLAKLTMVNFMLTGITLLIVWYAIGLPNGSFKTYF